MTINIENINNPEDIENNEVAEHLSILERYILTYIKFRSNNAHIYYGSNEDIAKHAQCKLSSAKTKVNQLIRQGYLDKGVDEYGRRTLTPTTKYYIPLDGVNMSNKSKSLMKQDIQNFERMEKQYKQDIAELKRARADLEHLCAMLRDAFLSKGYTINDIEKMVADGERKKLKNGFSENQNYGFSIEEQPKTIEEPLNKADEEVVLPSFIRIDNPFKPITHQNASNNDPQAVIDDILAKFKVPVA